LSGIPRFRFSSFAARHGSFHIEACAGARGLFRATIGAV
jgi:hypothetical protein